jgi:hypothetical protein
LPIGIIGVIQSDLLKIVPGGLGIGSVGKPKVFSPLSPSSLFLTGNIGLGLKEELDMIEDMNATAVLGIYDGYAANDESVPNTSQLDKYIQDAVNELQSVSSSPVLVAIMLMPTV